MLKNSSRQPRFFSALIWVATIIGVLALASEMLQTLSGRHAFAARAYLELERPAEALTRAESALRYYPYQVEANYSRLVALKQLERWTVLADSAHAAARWHPDSVPVLTLEAEAAWLTGRTAEANESIWAALWRAPTPRRSPAQAWRVAMLAGREVWGPRDPRPAAAAVRLLSLVDFDPTLLPGQRVAMRKEAAETLRQSGAPLTARAILDRK